MATEAPTWRVRYIPTRIQGWELAHFLCNLIVDLKPEQLYIRSIASDPEDHHNPPSQTATVQFSGSLPSCLSQRHECVFPVVGQSRPVVLDSHFLGFTQLNAVDSGQHDFDLIALSGLASHPFGSWKRRFDATSTNQATFMWLRDQIPQDFPALRVLIYGYDTELLKSESFQTVDDLALSFIERLRLIGKAKMSTKPFIIFAHSFGGVVLKRAMCILANGESTCESPLLTKLRMVIFFGVPSRGMKMSHLLPIVDGRPNEALLKCLLESDDNGYLGQLSESFLGITCFRGTRLVSAYETRRTRTAVETAPGIWRRDGEAVVLVSPDSAVLKSTRNPEDAFPIDRDHSSMVKFTEGDPYYYSVSEKLRDVILTSEKWIAFTESLKNDSLPETSNRMTDPLAREDLQIEASLRSLDFPERNRRLESIVTSHSKSFQWLSNNKIGLKAWLKSDSNFFWIRGKAGSGKSTLMKHLYGLLAEKASWRDLRFANNSHHVWYFFNQRGTSLQKSFEGLLRSVLHDLGKRSRSIAILIKDYYFTKDPKYRDTWSEDELSQLFTKVRIGATPDDHLTLFFDALDEYDGYPENIADFLFNLTGNSSPSSANYKIKVCFSSRPWDIFMGRFIHHEGFALQDWTVEDIKSYAYDRLRDLKMFKTRAFDKDDGSLEPRNKLRDTVSTIAHRSAGVFLWVRLATDELVNKSIQDSTDIAKTLDTVPTGIEEYYSWALRRIDQRHRKEAFIILELVLRSQVSVQLSHLLGAYHCAESKTSQESIIRLRLLRKDQPSDEEMSMNLENLCGGLLELYQVQMLGGYNTVYVQFIHQTAKDYASTSEMSKILLRNSQMLAPGNGHLFWLKYYLSNHKGLGQYYLPAESQEIGHHAHLAESTSGYHYGDFLDSVPKKFFQEEFKLQDQLAFALAADLRLYMTWKINKSLIPDSHLLNNDFQREVTIALNDLCESNLFYTKPIANSYHLGAMLDLLALYGVDLCEHGSEEPYKSLLYSDVFLYTRHLHQADYAPIVAEETKRQIVQAFLEAGNSSNIEVGLSELSINAICFHSYESLVHPGPFRPLHIYSGAMTKLLLKYGADPNSRDGLGNTPLDLHILRAEQQLKQSKYDRESGRADLDLDTVKILVEAHACLSHTVHQHFTSNTRTRRIPSLRNRFLRAGGQMTRFVQLIDVVPVLPESPHDVEIELWRKLFVSNKEYHRYCASLTEQRLQRRERDGTLAPEGRPVPLVATGRSSLSESSSSSE